MRIVQISDTHLSHLGGVPNENFELLAEFVNTTLRPDLIVNSGDVVLLSPDDEEDRHIAAKLHEAFDAPVRILPGNHDLGEAGEHPWMGLSVTSERLAGFRSVFGADRFVELTEDWAVVGMNSEILSSGLPEEQEQWSWLGEVAAEAGSRQVVLFLHKPLWSPVPGFTEHAIAVGEADRDRILELFADARLRAVCSGHLHRYRQRSEGEVLTISAPSTAFIVKSAALEGLNQVGVVEYVLEGEEIDAYFRSTPAVADAEPYGMPAFAETMAAIEAARVA